MFCNDFSLFKELKGGNLDKKFKIKILTHWRFSITVVSSSPCTLRAGIKWTCVFGLFVKKSLCLGLLPVHLANLVTYTWNLHATRSCTLMHEITHLKESKVHVLFPKPNVYKKLQSVNSFIIIMINYYLVCNICIF